MKSAEKIPLFREIIGIEVGADNRTSSVPVLPLISGFSNLAFKNGARARKIHTCGCTKNEHLFVRTSLIHQPVHFRFPMENSSRSRRFRTRFVALGTALSVAGFTGCSSGVAPSKTASGAGTGAMIGGVGGAVVGNNSSMGTGAGIVGGAAAGALIGSIVGAVQDAKDRREQDRLAQERAYQQELAKRRAEEAKLKASMDEELAIAEGFRISDLELNEAKKKLDQANERLKKLRDERTAALQKKKELDEAHEKTLSTEAEIARLEEELARLKGEDIPAGGAAKKAEGSPAPNSVKPGL